MHRVSHSVMMVYLLQICYERPTSTVYYQESLLVYEALSHNGCRIGLKRARRCVRQPRDVNALHQPERDERSCKPQMGTAIVYV